MPTIDYYAVLHTAIFAVGSLAIVFVGKLVRDFLAKRRGYDIGLLITVQDNSATAVEQAGFLIAVVTGLYGTLGVLVNTVETPGEQGLQLLLTGVIVVTTLLVNDWLTAKTVCRGMDNQFEVHEKRNLSVAVPRAASAIATGLILRAAIGHESALLDRLGWLVIGQAALIGISLLYQRLTPYDDIDELKKQNLAAGLPMAGILVAVGIIVEAALRGESEGWLLDLKSVGIDLLISLVLLQAVRWLTDKVLLPGTTLHDEIARDRNVGAGVLEMTSMLIGAWTLAFFLH